MEECDSPQRLVGLRSAVGGILVALLPLLGGCVSSGADVHLAPLYTRLSTGGGGTRSEALFGFWLAERERPNGPLSSWALRPLAGWRREPDGPVGEPPLENARWRLELLHPLGRVTSGERTSSSWFLPLYIWKSRETAGGGRRWTFLSLPGLWFAGDTHGGSSYAWFPIAGRVEDFLTYERLSFFLFPLWSSAERDGKRSQHFLWPIFGWTTGGGEHSHHVWPLYMHAEIDGFYDRTSVLWPIFHWQTNDLQRGEGHEQHMWMVWPLFGRTKRETYRSYSILWPFFGWATDPRGDFWALDAPWPLVRVQRGGQSPRADERTRLWPVYSHFRGDRLETWNVAWPLVHRRREVYPYAQRDSFYALPFWQSWSRVDAEPGAKSSWHKLWPFYQVREQDGRERLSILAPYPFHWDERFDFHWAWPFELWTQESRSAPALRSERAWGGLWRREKDAYEDRRSLTGLWSRRTFREHGRLVRETSLLFGLLRWRSMEGEGTDLLAPAFPGPGWPAERMDEPLELAPSPMAEAPEAPQ